MESETADAFLVRIDLLLELEPWVEVLVGLGEEGIGSGVFRPGRGFALDGNSVAAVVGCGLKLLLLVVLLNFARHSVLLILDLLRDCVYALGKFVFLQLQQRLFL